ncbi:MAG: hypothetical protein WAL02_16445, partial [Rhodoplanes sp.]
MAAVMVFEWPPTRFARSYTVTRWRWFRSQAADNPDMPVPTTAMRSGLLRPIFREPLCHTSLTANNSIIFGTKPDAIWITGH